MHLNDKFDNILFNKQIFNFDSIKLTGKKYNIKREKQKIYGVNSQLGKYKNINRGRNPKSVLKYSIIQNGKEYFGHPTQKPIGLIEHLIKASSNEYDVIFDPFLGSGTTALASKRLNRHFIGFEINKDYYDTGLHRLLNQPDKLENWIDV